MLYNSSCCSYKSKNMNKNKEIIGIDVSKSSLDVFSIEKGHHCFTNDEKGFKKLLKMYGNSGCYVMEATGCYHQLLAIYLHDFGVLVSVVNPLVIKRFIQMKLKKLKTDKNDSRMICQYGLEQDLEQWNPPSQYISSCKRAYGAISLYLKQRTALSNILHSLSSSGITKGKLVLSLNRQSRSLQKEIKLLELEVEKEIKIYDSELYTNLKSIPGIGSKTAMLLLIHTNGFRDFVSYKQLISYFGLAPTERSSGSSIRGRSRINKNGDGTIRNHLFMCSFTACNSNAECKALYDRIVNKGKSKKLALIAVCNKLLKQAFGVAKSGLVYDKNYKSVLN